MTGARVGPSRSEIVTTVVVVLLAAAGIFALWPRPDAARTPGTTAAAAVVDVPDAELASLRAAAALEPCPVPLGAGGAQTSRDGTGGAGPLVGVVVPCLGAPGQVDLGAALAGRPALLNLWASWCAPCRSELSVLAAYAARPGAVPVLGVDVQDDPRAALALLDELDVALPSVHDPGQALRAALDVPPGLPMSYLVRADGSVARVDPPVPFASVEDVTAAVERLS